MTAASLLGGVLLAVIGLRFFVSPIAAARSFGIPGRPTGFELHYAIGLRDVWLGLLALGFVMLRQWGALALWFAVGMFICFADATIAATSTGRWPQVAFHIICGLACICLSILIWQLLVRQR